MTAGETEETEKNLENVFIDRREGRVNKRCTNVSDNNNNKKKNSVRHSLHTFTHVKEDREKGEEESSEDDGQ